jgi:hypothetical protein
MRPRADLASFIGSSNFGPAEIRYFFMRREGSMRRRDVIAGLSVAAFWPLTARAEQPTMRVVGYLSSRSPDESAPHVAAFRQGLAEAGAVEGKNIAIEYRWAKGEYDRLPALAQLNSCNGRSQYLQPSAANPPHWQPRRQRQRFRSSPFLPPIRLSSVSLPAWDAPKATSPG